VPFKHVDDFELHFCCELHTMDVLAIHGRSETVLNRTHQVRMLASLTLVVSTDHESSIPLPVAAIVVQSVSGLAARTTQL